MDELPDEAKSHDPKTQAQSRHLVREHWPLFLILLLAAALRLWQIGESLWLDELHSAWVVSASLSDVAERAWIGNQSPVYFYLPWATTSLLGMNEWSLRLPSLIASVLLVIVAYSFIYEVTTSRVAACTTALLAALDTNFLFYATEVRPYACVQLVAVVQLFVFWKLQADATLKRRLTFVALSGLLFYLHYTAILLLVGEVVFALVIATINGRNRRPVAYEVGKVAIDSVCIVLLTAPLVLHLADIGSRRGNWASFIGEPSLSATIDWFSLDAYVLVPVVLCLVIAVSAILTQAIRITSLTAEGPGIRNHILAAILCCCWLVGPLTTVWISTVTDIARLYLLRYVIGAALAPMLIAGICVGIWKDRRLQTVVAICTVAFACYTSTIGLQWQYDGRLFGDRRENWREAVAFVNDSLRDGEVVFVRSGLLEADLIDDASHQLMRQYCTAPVASIYRIDDRASELRPLTTNRPGQLTADDVLQLMESGAGWFVVHGSERTTTRCRDQVVQSLSSKAKSLVVKHERAFGMVGVFQVVCTDSVVTDQPTSPNANALP